MSEAASSGQGSNFRQNQFVWHVKNQVTESQSHEANVAIQRTNFCTSLHGTLIGRVHARKTVENSGKPNYCGDLPPWVLRSSRTPWRADMGYSPWPRSMMQSSHLWNCAVSGVCVRLCDSGGERLSNLEIIFYQQHVPLASSKKAATITAAAAVAAAAAAAGGVALLGSYQLHRCKTNSWFLDMFCPFSSGTNTSSVCSACPELARRNHYPVIIVIPHHGASYSVLCGLKPRVWWAASDLHTAGHRRKHFDIEKFWHPNATAQRSSRNIYIYIHIYTYIHTYI